MLGRSIFTLRLVTPHGTRELTSKAVPAGGHLPSQGIYRVGPGGERLAWLAGTVMHVLDSDGRERTFGQLVRMFRFAPDGKQIAYVESSAIVLADLSTGALRTLGSIDAQYFLWMGWIRGGPFVVARTPAGPRTITYFPLDGAPRLVATRPEHIERAVGTPSSTRLIWFTESGIFTGDAAAGEPRRLADSPWRDVTTAEMAPDASEAAWSDSNGLYRVDAASGKVTRVAQLPATSLWYSPDGSELAYGWYSNAFVRRSEEVKRLLPHPVDKIRIGGVRFRRDAPGLLVLKNDDLLAWDPDRGAAPERVAHAAGLVDADLFRGGVVMVVARPDAKDPPRQRR